MVSLKPGDRVIIKLKEDKLVNPYEEEYHSTRILEIVALDGSKYCLFVPHYMFIHDTFTVDKYKCREMKLPTKYLGEEFLIISDSQIYKVFSILKGMPCDICKDFYEYAIPNQIDGSLICWSCKNRS
jgi:hypothetical protein